MPSTLPHNPSLPRPPFPTRPTSKPTRLYAFRRADLDAISKRVTSPEAWRKAWQTVNDSVELFAFEASKTAERIDRQYAVSKKLEGFARSAADRVKEIDREFEVGVKCRNLSLDFGRNWPKYRKQITNILDTPLGRSFATFLFLWFALSGWLFQFLIFATLILPFAAPLLIGSLSNKLLVKGNCPACDTQFVGLKNQTVQCTSCGNIVWQSQGGNSSGRGKRANTSKGISEVIDVEFEEK